MCALTHFCVHICVHACVRACLCMHAQKCSRIISLLYLLLGIPRLPQTMQDVFVTQEKLLTFPSYRPPIHLPPLPSVSIVLSNTLSPHERRCLCPFPSQWRNAKPDQQTSSCDKGFIFPYTWVALCVHLCVVVCICVSTYHLCVLSRDCRFPFHPPVLSLFECRAYVLAVIPSFLCSVAAARPFRSALDATGHCTVFRAPRQLFLKSEIWSYRSTLASLLFQLSGQYIGGDVCTEVSDVQSDLELPPGGTWAGADYDSRRLETGGK